MSSRIRFMWRRINPIKLNYKSRCSALIPILTPKTIRATVPYTLGFSLLTLIGLEKKLNAEDELIMTIKHCILFIQRNEFDKAEQLLHVALRQAQQINHQLGVTYVYDVMANLALEREQYSKAKQLFVAVSQRLLADGTAEDDPRLIHISAKLARISHMQHEYTTAQLGYDWCLEKLSAVIDRDPNENFKQLQAMIEDWYGRLFIDCDKSELGLKYLKSSYEKMKNIKDIGQDHLVIQLNDIGTVCDKIGAVDESIKYFKEAIDMGKTIEDMPDLGAMYVNLGRAYMKKNLLDFARKTCGYGWKLGVMAKNNDIKSEAELCLKEIKNMV
ncbi:tetratricopeptide repeat protein 19 homolog, mitochondrial [Danaus plexippus]|nr:tetratricopeptide repeat protein 19 homolog, mitochondrial [Danaus plexippus]